MKRLAFCAFWLFIFCSPSIGQVNTGPKVITRNLRQDKKGNIKSEHADNRGMIFGILEASDGSIWFGALDGVHRYNLTTNTASRLD